MSEANRRVLLAARPRGVPEESDVEVVEAEGFLVMQFADRHAEARARLAEWLAAGQLVHRETITDGLENAPQAFIGLFAGENIGKQLVRVAPEG